MFACISLFTPAHILIKGSSSLKKSLLDCSTKFSSNVNNLFWLFDSGGFTFSCLRNIIKNIIIIKSKVIIIFILNYIRYKKINKIKKI